MPYLPRVSEGQAVDQNTLKVFSKVARWGGFAAAKRVQKIIGSHLSSAKIVVDIGTGPATIPIYLKRFYPDVQFSGLDISMGMLEKAKENRTILEEAIDLVAGDGEMLPFAPNSIDVITTFFSLHHMNRPELFLKEVARVLKPNGLFLSIDFKRDMSRLLYHVLNTLWQCAFFFSNGRFGIKESIQASWQADEIEKVLKQNNLHGFGIHVNMMELWIYRGLH